MGRSEPEVLKITRASQAKAPLEMVYKRHAKKLLGTKFLGAQRKSFRSA